MGKGEEGEGGVKLEDRNFNGLGYLALSGRKVPAFWGECGLGLY